MLLPISYALLTCIMLQTLTGLPREPEAHAILTGLAEDPGVRAVLALHKWTVGCLAEMYPEGKVSVCY
jgi:WLM domain